jgi:NAD dependent epimerase/dehydratase family enzyme
VLGHGGALEKMLPPFKLALGGPIGNGQQWMPWIHIADMVAVIMHCLSNANISGPVNAYGAQPGRLMLSFPQPWVLYCIDRRLLPMPALMVKILFRPDG